MAEFVYFEKLVINKNIIVSLVEDEETSGSKILTPMGTTFSTGEPFDSAKAKIKEAEINEHL